MWEQGAADGVLDDNEKLMQEWNKVWEEDLGQYAYKPEEAKIEC